MQGIKIEGCNYHKNGEFNNATFVIVDLNLPDLIGLRHDRRPPYCNVSSLPGVREIVTSKLAGISLDEYNKPIAAVEARCNHTDCIHHINH